MKFNTAIIVSIVIHIGVIALLLTNYEFSKVELKQTGSNQPKINAKAVDSKRVEQLVEKIKKQKTDQKRKEQKRLDDLKKAEQQAKKRRQEEEKKAEDARKRRENAERKRKEEESKALALKKKRQKEEEERKKKAEQEKKRKAEADRKRKADEERKRKAEEERKRKAKEEAERKRKEAEEKARQEALEREMQAQMDAEAAELAAARQAAVMSEVDIFNTRIRSKIERNWFKPETIGQCTFRIKMSPGGLVINIEVIDGTPAHCESGRRAILRAEPLPVSKDPDVFNVLKTRTFKLENENEQQ